MMERLISMTDFVLYKSASKSLKKTHLEIINYAFFLDKHIELGMFIPVDDDGNVLEEPNRSTHTNEECEIYNAAKERVLFEGFKICNRLESVKCVVNGDFHFSYDKAIKNGERIEDLVKYGLTTTTTAQKQIFG